MRKTFIATFVVITLMVISLSPALSVSEAEVTATVSTEVISISVTPTSADYGTLPVGTVDSNPIGNPDFTVTNTGTVNEDFNLKGSNATNGGNEWVLADTPGANQFVHKYGVSSSPSTYAPLNTTAGSSPLANNKTPSSGENFKLKLSTPTSFSGPQGEYITTVTVVATKTSS